MGPELCKIGSGFQPHLPNIARGAAEHRGRRRRWLTPDRRNGHNAVAGLNFPTAGVLLQHALVTGLSRKRGTKAMCSCSGSASRRVGGKGSRLKRKLGRIWPRSGPVIFCLLFPMLLPMLPHLLPVSSTGCHPLACIPEPSVTGHPASDHCS